MLGLVLYPAGWGSRRIQMVCGNKTGPYYIGDCSMGMECRLYKKKVKKKSACMNKGA